MPLPDRSRALAASLPAPFMFLAACATSAPSSNGPQEPTTTIFDLPTGPTFSLQIDAGLREFRGDAWDELDDQGALGITFITAPETWPVALEAGLAYAQGRGDVGTEERDSRTLELALGLRHEAPLGGVFSFAGGAGGFAARTVDHEGGGWFDAHARDSDGWYGWYLHGGVYADVSDRVRLGVDVRWRDGSELEIEGVERNGDSTQYALSVIVGL